MEFWKVPGEPPGPTSASLWRIAWSFWACKYPSYKKSFNPMSFLGPRYRRSFGAVWTGPWNLIPYSLKIKVFKRALLTPCLMTSLDSSLAVLRAMALPMFWLLCIRVFVLLCCWRRGLNKGSIISQPRFILIPSKSISQSSNISCREVFYPGWEPVGGKDTLQFELGT